MLWVYACGWGVCMGVLLEHSWAVLGLSGFVLRPVGTHLGPGGARLGRVTLMGHHGPETMEKVRKNGQILVGKLWWVGCGCVGV